MTPITLYPSTADRTINCPTPPRSGVFRLSCRAVRTGCGKATDLIRLWAARRRERCNLATLSDHQLRDIGVTRERARREARLPFWRA